jgi:hypothetical protein
MKSSIDNVINIYAVKRGLQNRSCGWEYIEVFYNRQRRQARLGYLSPAVYERQFYVRQVAA